MGSPPILLLSALTKLLLTLIMTWEVVSEYSMSASEQNAFIRIVENAIRRHTSGGEGKSSSQRHAVAKEIRNECRDEFAAKGQDWLVIYDTNGNYQVSASAYKRILVKNPSKFDFVEAYRF